MKLCIVFSWFYSVPVMKFYGNMCCSPKLNYTQELNELTLELKTWDEYCETERAKKGKNFSNSRLQITVHKVILSIYT